MFVKAHLRTGLLLPATLPSIVAFTRKTNHTALTMLCECLGFQRLSSAAFCLQFCQGSKVTDECVTGEAGTCQQPCHKNRCNHGNLVWTCQLRKSGDALFLLYHYSAMDMPVWNKVPHSRLQNNGNNNTSSGVMLNNVGIDVVVLSANIFHYFLRWIIYLNPAAALSESQFWNQGIGFHS